MSGPVKSYLDVMSVRLGMIDAGVIFPSRSVADATRKLVQRLGELDPEEEIEVSIARTEPLKAKYIRIKTGDLLAEIDAIKDI
ncbi:hypothetical protein MCEZEM1_03337 [Comamonadaceae bacterium]